jgi:hypothetical protein
VLQVPLAIGQESETAALGAALQAQWSHFCARAGAQTQAPRAELAAMLANVLAPHMAAAARVEPDRTLTGQAADGQAQHRQKIALLYGVHA